MITTLSVVLPPLWQPHLLLNAIFVVQLKSNSNNDLKIVIVTEERIGNSVSHDHSVCLRGCNDSGLAAGSDLGICKVQTLMCVIFFSFKTRS